MSARMWILVVAILGACGGEDRGAENEAIETLPASVPAPEVEDGVLIVTPEQVRDWLDAGDDLVLVDARDRVQYEREHIPGAINISYVAIRPGAQLPPRDARVVVYCSDADCPISEYAYRSLQSLGFTEVYDMRAGLAGWKTAGYATELGPAES